jgi:multiple sugar transport system permease protein
MKKRVSIILIYILLIFLLLICVFPFYIMIINATHSTQELYTGLQIIPGRYFFENMGHLTDSVNIARGFGNSFYVSILSTALSIYFGAMTAFGLFEYKFKLKKLIYTLLMVSMMVPGQLGIIGLFRLSRSLNILDTYWPLILPSVANSSTIFFVYQYLNIAMDDDLLDAARIDGSTEVELFHKFVLPLSKPSLATMAIFNFVAYWNNFFTPMILLFSEEKFTVPLIVNNLNNGMLQDLGAMSDRQGRESLQHDLCAASA